jgi:hypothetical protein
MSPRKHGLARRLPSCSHTSGIAVSPLHARRWSRCARTSFRISRNGIDKSAWLNHHDARRWFLWRDHQSSDCATERQSLSMAVSRSRRLSHSRLPSEPLRCA